MNGPTLTGNRCQCMACGDWFNSTSTFDRHRVGAFETPMQASTRRCLSAGELTARGWQRNAAGFWIERPRQGPTIRAQGPRMNVPARGVTGREESQSPYNVAT